MFVIINPPSLVFLAFLTIVYNSNSSYCNAILEIFVVLHLTAL